jgi:hypothetical protein
MKVSVIAVSAVLSCTALSCSGTASAQPRVVDEAGGDPVPDADMDVWLRRLVGNYKLDGAANSFACPSACSGVKGKVDCIAIGTGPGVQCVLNATWQEYWDMRGNPTLVDYLDPSMMLFGVDPGRSAINMLLVNDKGLPEGGFGRIKGNTATFYSPCVNTPVHDISAQRTPDPSVDVSSSSEASGSEGSGESSSDSPAGNTSTVNSSDTVGGGTGCTHPVRIEAKADANIIYMWTEPYGVLLQLRRIRTEEGSAAPAPPAPPATRSGRPALSGPGQR